MPPLIASTTAPAARASPSAAWCRQRPGRPARSSLLEIRSFDPAALDKKARKAFPLRLAHFLTDTTRVRRELAWEPAFDLEATIADSYTNDYALRTPTSPDFSADEALIG